MPGVCSLSTTQAPAESSCEKRRLLVRDWPLSEVGLLPEMSLDRSEFLVIHVVILPAAVVYQEYTRQLLN